MSWDVTLTYAVSWTRRCVGLLLPLFSLRDVIVYFDGTSIMSLSVCAFNKVILVVIVVADIRCQLK